VLLARVGGGATGLDDDGECVECASGREPRSIGGGDATESLVLSDVTSGRVRSGGGTRGPRREVLADTIGADGGGRL